MRDGEKEGEFDNSEKNASRGAAAVAADDGGFSVCYALSRNYKRGWGMKMMYYLLCFRYCTYTRRKLVYGWIESGMKEGIAHYFALLLFMLLSR